jgi:hypothetical protein
MMLLPAREAMYDLECRGNGLVRMVPRSSGGGHRSSGVRTDNSARIVSSGKTLSLI